MYRMTWSWEWKLMDNRLIQKTSIHSAISESFNKDVQTQGITSHQKCSSWDDKWSYKPLLDEITTSRGGNNPYCGRRPTGVIDIPSARAVMGSSVCVPVCVHLSAGLWKKKNTAMMFMKLHKWVDKTKPFFIRWDPYKGLEVFNFNIVEPKAM